MLFLVKSNPEYSSKLLVEAKGTCALFLFLLAAKKKAFIVSFRWDTKILTADRTAGSAAVCKAWRVKDREKKMAARTSGDEKHAPRISRGHFF